MSYLYPIPENLTKLTVEQLVDIADLRGKEKTVTILRYEGSRKEYEMQLVNEKIGMHFEAYLQWVDENEEIIGDAFYSISPNPRHEINNLRQSIRHEQREEKEERQEFGQSC